MNEVVIYRENPLSISEFQKLETLAEKFMEIKSEPVSKLVPVKDHEGNIYSWEYDIVKYNTAVDFKIVPDKKIMESILRPATNKAIGIHLARLCQHKPYARGAEGFKIIMEDMLHDLSGISEWVILKICEKFRLDAGIKFFPDTADFVLAAKRLDAELKSAYGKINNKPESQITSEKRAAVVKRTEKQKRHIGILCRLSQKPRSSWSFWERKFFNLHWAKSNREKN